MTEFVNSGWAWFIALTTLVSLVGLILLASRVARRRHPSSTTETSDHVWDEDLAEYNNPLPRWWLNLFYVTIGWGLAYLLAYPGLGAYRGFLNWSQQGQFESEMADAKLHYDPLFEKFAATDLQSLMTNPQALKVGARLFASYCVACHGSDARGARHFPNLRDDDWLYGGAPATIETSILHGRQGAMPAWDKIIGEDGVRNVTAFVEGLSGRKTDSSAATKGATVFRTYCAACHGSEGKGNQALGAPNLTDDIWLHGGTTERIAESIRLGRNGMMPAHAESLGVAKVHVLAAYVASLPNLAAPTQVED
ncbi:MAG: cytochrome-c oxidase, cbb3-type subunit III [Gammaproteobacteria bacterium]|nr:cytochrome-c oxidase, cbb3-type subunit III [Gammaproteobacteria bacterium]